MRHTKGPWVVVDGEVSTESKPWPIIGWLNQEKPTDDIVIGCGCDDWEANAERIVDCVNGCDTAVIVDPGKLESALQAIRAASDTIRRGGSSTRQALLKINEAISSLYRSS